MTTCDYSVDTVLIYIHLLGIMSSMIIWIVYWGFLLEMYLLLYIVGAIVRGKV